jgi:hypothetical protein
VSKRILLFAIFALAARSAQPAAYFARHLGGDRADLMGALLATSDGGQLLGGYTFSFGAGGADAWAVKLDAVGNIAWQKAIGGSANDTFYSVIETSDGGFLCAGESFSVDADGDALVVKFEADGDVAWQRLYGGDRAESGRALIVTEDGGYLLVGPTTSFGQSNSTDAWVVKLTSSGAIEWQRTYGGTGYDDAYAIAPAGAGAFVLTGETTSFGDPDGDVWYFKIDDEGALVWQKVIGGPNTDLANAVRATSDGGFILGAQTGSFGAGNFDTWLVKVDAAGAVTWQKAYGGNGEDSLLSLSTLADRGFLVAAATLSFGLSRSEAWILRLDRDGGIGWQRTYGGSANESAFNLAELGDGRLIAIGFTDSYGTGGNSMFLRLAASGEIHSSCETFVETTNATITNTSAAVVNATATAGTSNSSPNASTYAVVNTSTTLGSICGSPDLADLSGAFESVEASGNQIDAAFRVRNVGALASGDFSVKVYFSKKPKLNNKSVLITTESIDGLATGRSMKLNISGTKGRKHKYLVAVIDPAGEISEESEGNNLIVAPLPQ